MALNRGVLFNICSGSVGRRFRGEGLDKLGLVRRRRRGDLPRRGDRGIFRRWGLEAPNKRCKNLHWGIGVSGRGKVYHMMVGWTCLASLLFWKWHTICHICVEVTFINQQPIKKVNIRDIQRWFAQHPPKQMITSPICGDPRFFLFPVVF